MNAAREPLLPGAPLLDLPLFPLGTVLFPGGLLPLRIFEARYLDLMSHCLRNDAIFGVVTLVQGSETRTAQGHDGTRFEAVGCLARLLSCDSHQPGILQVRCEGLQRFECHASAPQRDGLWRSAAVAVAPDAAGPPTPELAAAARALAQAIVTLEAQGEHPFPLPHRLDDAGWVANRWCEILPLPLPTRHKLMALADPWVRLQLVDGFLRRHGIVED